MLFGFEIRTVQMRARIIGVTMFLGTALLAVPLFVHAVRDLHDGESGNRFGRISELVSPIAQQTRIERGRTVLALTSRSAADRTTVLEQRRRLDDTIEKSFEDLLPLLEDEAEQDFVAWRAALKDLRAVALTPDASAQEVMSRYDGLVGDVSNRLASESTGLRNRQLHSQAIAVLLLDEIGEALGRERALMSRALVLRSHEPEVLIPAAEMGSRADYLIGLAETQIPAHHRPALHTATGSPTAQTIRATRDAFRRDPEGVEMSPQEWFEVSTTWIDAFFAMKSELAVEAKVQAEEGVLRARAKMGVLVVAGLVVLSAYVMGLVVFRERVKRPLIRAAHTCERLAMGDVDVEIVESDDVEFQRFEMALIEVREYMREISVSMGGLAEGDLTHRPFPRSTSDRLGRSVVTMFEGLSSLLGEIRVNSALLRDTSQGLTMAAKQSSVAVVAATEESQSLSTAVEEMHSSILELASNAGESTDVVTKANGAVNRAASSVRELNASSDEINEVLALIDDIAEQTNLLALNATIEAARAGEVGKGFAVVANEVKKLAEQTARATEEVGSKVASIRHRVSEAMASMEEISGGIDQVQHMSVDLAGAVQRQSQTAGEIAMSVTSMHQSTEMSRATTQSAGHAIQEIAGLGTALDGLLQRFRLPEDASSRVAAAEEISVGDDVDLF